MDSEQEKRNEMMETLFQVTAAIIFVKLKRIRSEKVVQLLLKILERHVKKGMHLMKTKMNENWWKNLILNRMQQQQVAQLE